jgi:WD40 repeat protein
MLCSIQTLASPAMIQFSPDSSQITYRGSKLMMASRNDRSLWFWDTHTCEVNFQKQVIHDDDFEHNAEFIDYSDDGRYLMFTDYIEGGNFLWDAVSWENLGVLSRDEIGYTTIIGFSPDSNHIVFENEDGKIIKIWNIESQAVIQEYEGTHAWYLSDGRLIINRDGESYLVTETGEQIIYDPQPTTHTYVTIDEDSKSELVREIRGLVYPSPDNKYVAFRDDNGFISILRLDSLDERQIKDFINTGDSIYWSQSDNIAVTYGGTFVKNFIDVWVYAESGFEHIWRKSYTEDSLTAITDEFVILEIENHLEFFDIQTGELMYSFPASDCASQSSLTPACDNLATAMPLAQTYSAQISVEPNVRISEDGNHLEVFDLITNETITSYPTPIEDRASYNSSWRFDENGDLLLATESKLYNLTQNSLIVEMSPIVAGYRCMDCDPDSELSPYYYESRRSWLSDDLRFLLSLEEDRITHDFTLRGVEDSAVIRVWDIQANQEVVQIAISPIDSFKFISNLDWLFVFRRDASNGNGTQVWLRGNIIIYNGLTGENLANLSIHRESEYDMPLHDAQFSPDNRFLITLSDTLRVWAVVEP